MKSFKFVFSFLCLTFFVSQAFAQAAMNPIPVTSPASSNYLVLWSSTDSVQITFTSTTVPPKPTAIYGCGANMLPVNETTPIVYAGPCLVQVQSGPNCKLMKNCKLATGPNPVYQKGNFVYTFEGTDGRTIILTVPASMGPK